MLTTERVTVEMMKALTEKKPSDFFFVLNEVGALEKIFPELYALIGQTQPEKWHAEGDAFVHTMMVVDVAAVYGASVRTVFCALVHDLGKGLTPKHLLPKHYGHEAAGVPIVEAMCDRLKLPNDFRKYGKAVAKYHMHVHKAHDLKATTYVNIFEEFGYQGIDILKTVAEVSFYDHKGRITLVDEGPYTQNKYFIEVMEKIATIKVANLMTEEEIKNSTPDRIKSILRNARINVAKSITKK